METDSGDKDLLMAAEDGDPQEADNKDDFGGKAEPIQRLGRWHVERWRPIGNKTHWPELWRH